MMTSLVLVNWRGINSHIDYNVGHFNCSLILEFLFAQDDEFFYRSSSCLGYEITPRFSKVKC